MTRRGGLLDLLLVVLVLSATWTRSPLGAIVSRGVAAVRGVPSSAPPLASYFETVPSALLTRWLSAPATYEAAPEDGFPDPWRRAAAQVLAEGVPDAAVAQMQARGLADPLALLDELWQGDPEAALETLAVGPDLRVRAIARARAAGRPDAVSYAAHRRYLPSRAAADADRVVEGALVLADLARMLWPVEAPHRISSPYGTRQHPVLKIPRFHNGIDIAVPVGTSVRAPDHSTVEKVREDDVNGRWVTLEHRRGIRTTYCHLERIDVEKGQELVRGQAFALSGNTGRSTGPHVHYIVRVGKQTVDPGLLRPAERAERATTGAAASADTLR